MQLIIIRKKRERKKNKLNIEKLSTHGIEEGLPCNVETTFETSGFEAAGSLSNRAISPDIVGARN